LCILSKYFFKAPDYENMSIKQINKRIYILDQKINDEKISTKLENKDINDNEKLYKLITKRDHALLILQDKIDANN